MFLNGNYFWYLGFLCGMKEFYGFLILLASIYAYPQAQKVDFRIQGLNDSLITVGYYFGDKRYVVDTLEKKNGGFTLSSEMPQQTGLYFLYSENFYFEFVMDTTDFSISTQKGSGYEAVAIKGSEENLVFKIFRTRLEGFQSQQQEQLAKLKAGNERDSLQARKSLGLLEEKVRNVRDSIIRVYPQSFTASFVQLMKEPNIPSYDSIPGAQKRAEAQYRYYRKHFLDGVGLDDSRLLRTPLLHDKVIRYLDKIIPQHPDTINQELDRLFNEIGDNEELFRYWLVTLFKKYEQSRIMGMDAVTIHLIEKYYLSEMANWLTDEFEKKLREEVAFVKPNLIGKPAPRLNVVDTLLQPFYIEQVEQPFLVLYFYDPECGHCKKASKALKQEYDKLQGLGAEVLAVCTVTDIEKWKKYIRENDLPWLHVADPYSEGRFRITYNVRSTPKIYVLGPERKILAKQLEVEQLAGLIERMQ